MQALSLMTATPTTSSSVPVGAGGKTTPMGGQALGVTPNLFLSLLAQGGVPSLGQSPLSSMVSGVTTPQNSSPTATFSPAPVKGFGMESALLVLPEGLTSLTEENLKALIASQANGEDVTLLSGDVLTSLTPGTPSAQAIANFLSHHGKDTVLTTLPLSNVPVTTDSLATSGENANILLVATNLSPSDMEALRSFLKANSGESRSESGIAESETLPLSDESGSSATDTLAVALVMLAPPQFANHLVTQSDALDISLKATPAFATQSGLSGKELGMALKDMHGPLSPAIPMAEDTNNLASPKKASPFAISGTESSEVSATPSFAPSKDAGYKGSIAATLDSTTTGQSIADKITGKLDSSSGFTLGHMTLPMTEAFPSDLSVVTPPPMGMGNSSSAITSPVTAHPSAGSAHPAAQTISAVLEKMAATSTQGAKQNLSIQLDPADLGRVQIQLSYERGEPMKVKLLAEKQDTLTMLQRDSHALKSTLEQAGIQMDGSSLSFDLAGGDQSFNQLLGHSQDGQGHKQNTRFTLDGLAGLVDDALNDPITTAVNSITYMENGKIRYSILA